MAENMPTIREIKDGARRHARELHRIDIPPSARNRALWKIKAQKDFAILIARFMERNGIDSIQELLCVTHIGEDHEEAIEWLRDPFGKEEKEITEYLISLSLD